MKHALLAAAVCSALAAPAFAATPPPPPNTLPTGEQVVGGSATVIGTGVLVPTDAFFSLK